MSKEKRNRKTKKKIKKRKLCLIFNCQFILLINKIIIISTQIDTAVTIYKMIFVFMHDICYVL